MSIREEAERRIRENDPLVNEFFGTGGGVILCKRTISFKDEDGIKRRALNPSISASLVDGAQAQQRVTVTRIAVMGIFAFGAPKRTQGTRFLIVEGPDFFWTLEVPMSCANEAMTMVGMINDLCRRSVSQTEAPSSSQALDSPQVREVKGALGDNLKMLAELLKNNVISSEEFDTLKSRVMRI